MPSRLTLCCLIAVVVLTTAVQPVASQEPRPDHNPLEAAWYLSTKLPAARSLDRNNLLAEVAWSYYRLRQPEKALQILATIPAGKRGDSAAYLTQSAIKDGDREFALRLLQRTWEAVIKAGANGSNPAWPTFAKQFLALGQLEQAAVVARSVEDSLLTKVEAMVAVSNGFVAAKQNQRAEALADEAFSLIRADGSENQVTALLTLPDLGTVYGMIGRRDSANEAFELALHLADAEEDGAEYSNRDMFRRSILTAMAGAGQLERATELADLLNSRDRIGALAAVGNEYAKAGKRTEALAVLDGASRVLNEVGDSEIGYGYDRRDLMRAYLAAGSPVQAEVNLRAIRPGLLNNEATLEAVDWYLRHEQKANALRVLDLGTQNLKTIVSEGSNEIAPEWYNSHRQTPSPSFGDIPRKYVELKEYDRALTAINAIGLRQYQAGLLADLARALVATGQRSKALSTVDRAHRLMIDGMKYPTDADELITLANVAGIYGELGEQETSVRLFLRALSDLRLADKSEGGYKLSEIGFYFDQANLKPDVRIKRQLRSLIELLWN